MPDVKRGDLVQIHIIILEPDQRADSLPSCTKAVPYECWIKGFLLNEEATMGEMVQIETFIGRKISGILEETMGSGRNMRQRGEQGRDYGVRPQHETKG